MFWSAITPEEMAKIVAFLENDDTTVLGTDIPSKFLGLFFAFQRKMQEQTAKTRSENARLQRRLQKYEAKEQADIEAGEFSDLGLDSVCVARAILYVAKARDAKMSYPKLMAILYDVYAVWLASHRQRLFIEHPVAQESGPWFWRVAKQIKVIYEPVDRRYLDELYRVNPGIGRIVERAAAKYCDQQDKDLADWLCRSAPYRERDKSRNGGKWNGELSDSSIYHWKCELMGK